MSANFDPSSYGLPNLDLSSIHSQLPIDGKAAGEALQARLASGSSLSGDSVSAGNAGSGTYSIDAQLNDVAAPFNPQGYASSSDVGNLTDLIHSTYGGGGGYSTKGLQG